MQFFGCARLQWCEALLDACSCFHAFLYSVGSSWKNGFPKSNKNDTVKYRSQLSAILITTIILIFDVVVLFDWFVLNGMWKSRRNWRAENWSKINSSIINWVQTRRKKIQITNWLLNHKKNASDRYSCEVLIMNQFPFIDARIFNFFA